MFLLWRANFRLILDDKNGMKIAQMEDYGGQTYCGTQKHTITMKTLKQVGIIRFDQELLYATVGIAANEICYIMQQYLLLVYTPIDGQTSIYID